MLQCIEKQPRPCLHYQGRDKESLLNQFLIENGGVEAEFLKNGTAIIKTMVKNAERFAYLMPTAWIRVVSPGQFSVVSAPVFAERFVLIDETKPEAEAGERKPQTVKTMAKWLQMIRKASGKSKQ